MNLYLRLLWTILRSLFKPPIKVGDTIEAQLRVLPNDIDINGHMNNGRYLTVVDLLLIEYFVRCGFAGIMLKRGWRPMLGGAIIHFRRGLKPFKQYTLRFRLVCWDERWNYLAFEFIREGQICASGLTKGAVIGAKGFVGNASAYATLGVSGDSPAETAAVSSWRAADAQLMAGSPLAPVDVSAARRKSNDAESVSK